MKRRIELDIVDLAYNGQAIGYDNGKVTFVKGVLPGERIEAQIIKTKKNHNQARMLRILTPSPERIVPVCEHFEICGGCTWQDLDYERQLFYKRKQVTACLEHIGGFKNIEVEDIRRAPEIYFYRNKMEFSFHTCKSEIAERGFTLGLHERGRFDRVFDINKCHLQSDLSNQIVGHIRKLMPRLGIPAYDLIRHTGFMRFAIIREGKISGQTMLVLVSGGGEFPAKEEFTNALITRFPQLTSIIWVVNDTLTNIARGEIREALHGPEYIEEEILGLKFRISPGSFFQTNSRQAQELYRAAIEAADINPDDTILDLYCGTGAIGICAAPKAGRVIGIEIEKEAVDAARINAEINNLDNCAFYAGAARKILDTDDVKDISFDVVFNDPPRAGMHPRALKRLIEIDAPRLIYISCNPATFARDAAALRDAGYVLRTVKPFDMFPHTMHIELVSRFEKTC